ncbi:MAG: hypothetical protein AAF383_12875 [Cyanobacteria bacterium P01_A01_bin.83]
MKQFTVQDLAYMVLIQEELIHQASETLDVAWHHRFEEPEFLDAAVEFARESNSRCKLAMAILKRCSCGSMKLFFK